MRPRLTNRVAERVLERVSSRAGVPVSDIIGPSTARRHTAPRHHAMRMMRRMGYSVEDIGMAVNRHHTAVVRALRGAA